MSRKRPPFALFALLLFGCSGESFSSAGNQLSDSGSNESGGSSQGTGGRPNASGGSAQRTGGRPGSGGKPASGGYGGVAGTGSSSSGGTSGGGTGGDGGARSDSGIISTDGGVVTPDGGAISCWGPVRSFPTFDKGCSDDANCTLVRHTTDCCGGQLMMAINHGEVARFNAAETICDAQYPGCGCAAQGVVAEDGTLVPFGSENLIVAKCDNGQCASKYAGAKFACGTTTCPDLDYCSATVSGVPGGGTSYLCMPLYGCTTCACLGSSASCQCTQGAVGITVTCYAP
jgi:hypothetical protein